MVSTVILVLTLFQGQEAASKGLADGKPPPTSALQEDKGFIFQPTVALGSGRGDF